MDVCNQHSLGNIVRDFRSHWLILLDVVGKKQNGRTGCVCFIMVLMLSGSDTVSGNFRLYTNGVSVNPMALYPPVEVPVSSATPMLSSLIRWDHSGSWEVPTAAEFLALSSDGSGNGAASTVEVNVSAPDSEDAYLTGHVIDGRVLFPATGYLVLAWRQLARMNGQSYQQTPVCFDDVHIQRATILPSSGKSVCHDCEICVFSSWFIPLLIVHCVFVKY